MHYLLSIYLIN